MARANVPQFGNWENEDNVPYTVYFDKARKTKDGKTNTPNAPVASPDINFNIHPSRFVPVPVPAPRPKPRTKVEENDVWGSVRQTPEHMANRDIKYKQFSNPPGRNGNMNQTTPSYAGLMQRPTRYERPSAGSELEHSPFHLQGRGTGFDTWDRTNYENAPGKPARSRPRPVTQRDDSFNIGTPIPKFGNWDETDPKSAENYTGVFDQVRAERTTAPAPMLKTPNHPSQSPHVQPSNKSKKMQKCCFPWCQKKISGFL